MNNVVMSSSVCDYCGKKFSSKCNMLRHQRTAKSCLRLQREESGESMDLICEHCGKTYYRSDYLAYHKKKCSNRIKKALRDVPEDSDPQTEDEQTSLLNKFAEILNGDGSETKTPDKNMLLMVKFMEIMQQQNTKLINVINAQNTSGSSSQSKRNSAAENLKPITDKDLVDYLDNLSLDFVRRGAKGYADYAGNYPFKGKIICTDRSRKKIQYKNPDGTITTDGRTLAQRFFQAIAEKNSYILNKEYTELSNKLKNIVEANSAGEEDVSDILKRATFVQDMLIKTANAAQGKDDEFIQMFLSHLSKLA